MNPKFSIIIPVYNVAPYLRECLDSVLAQTVNDLATPSYAAAGWEAICVDDGSTDGSGAILDEYAAKDKRFVVIHKANGGVSSARNAGIERAKNEWILFVDADDRLKPLALERLARIENKADVTFFGMEECFPEGYVRSLSMPTKECLPLNDETSAWVRLFFMNEAHINMFGWPWDKMIRRRLLTENGIRFNESLWFFEDEIFALELFRHTKTFGVISDKLYQYRVVGSGLTAKGYSSQVRIAEHYLREARLAKYDGLRFIAYKQAYAWARKEFNTARTFSSARMLIEIYRENPGSFLAAGKFKRIVGMLARLPIQLGARFLWLSRRVRP